MNDEIHAREAERLLERQQPGTAHDAVPPMPAELRQSWSRHFDKGARRVSREHRSTLTLLAVAACLALGMMWIWHHAASKPQTQPEPTSIKEELLAFQDFATSNDNQAGAMSPFARELRRYQQPSGSVP